MSTPPSTPDIFATLTEDFFEALIAKGIHAILFRVKRDGTTDKTKNLLYGVPIGNIKLGGESVDMEDFQDQIRGGMHKNKIGGAIDPGDVAFDGYYNPNVGKPDVVGVVNSMAVTPEFILTLARKKSKTVLEGFFAAGVNYAGGMDITGDYGKVVKSSLKFSITGEPLYGYDDVGDIAMSLYEAGKTS